jgi:hypothetical protein
METVPPSRAVFKGTSSNRARFEPGGLSTGFSSLPSSVTKAQNGVTTQRPRRLSEIANSKVTAPIRKVGAFFFAERKLVGLPRTWQPQTLLSQSNLS